jgi:hypothetical protein
LISTSLLPKSEIASAAIASSVACGDVTSRVINNTCPNFLEMLVFRQTAGRSDDLVTPRKDLFYEFMPESGGSRDEPNKSHFLF